MESDFFWYKKLSKDFHGLEKIDVLSQHVVGIKSELKEMKAHVADVNGVLKALKSLMEKECKQTQLQRALSFTDYGSFKYCCEGVQTDSSELAKDIKKAFIHYFGCYLPANAQNCVQKMKKTARKCSATKLLSRLRV